MTTEKPGLRRHGRLSLRSLASGALAVSLLAVAPSLSLAADCAGTFTLSETSTSWFNNTGKIIRYSPDGTKVAVYGASFANGANDLVVLDLPGMTKNTTLSKSIGNSTYQMEWTKQGGIIVGLSGGQRYISPAGVVTSLSMSGDGPLDIYPVTGTTKTLVMTSASGTTYRVYVVDDANTAAPTVTQITGFGTVGATSFTNADPVIAANATRIFLSREDTTFTSARQSTIKAYTWSGAYVSSGWTDIPLDYDSTANTGDGYVGDMGVRPTDGLVFARVQYRGNGIGWNALSPVVVFDQSGSTAVSAGFNLDDLSVLGTSSDRDTRITFDPAGNIYGNLFDYDNYGLLNGYCWGSGVVKFDPKGNIDFGFTREVLRSYVHPSGAAAVSFDINQATGLVGVISNSGSSFCWAIDPTHRRHLIEQNEHWTSNSINGSNSTKYGNVQFWFNSGLLLRPNVDATTAAAVVADNCGIQPVVTAPAADSAAATIDCAKTAFMPAPVAGVAQQLSVLVTLNVTKAGVFNPVTISGSGLSVPANFTITASTTGVQQFVVPVNYSGATLGTFDLTIGDAGTCTGSLASTPTNNTKDAQIKIWTVDNCTYKLAGPALK